MKNQQGLQSARGLLLSQLGLTLLMAMTAMIFSDALVARSILLGGLVNAVPNACFAAMAFRYQGARAAKQIVNGFYKGEALKILLSMVLFTLVFKYVNIAPLGFFVAYMAVQLMVWCVPLMIDKQNRLERD